VSAPDTVFVTDDPGDETGRRYRYQWSYASIVCCMLLDETLGVAEVFCEHHEDILIKHVDGTFAGLQIKTRDLDQPVWKTSDDGVRSACVRFAKLEAKFPGQFRKFSFLTNHPLHTAGNGKDLRHVLKQIKDSSSSSELSTSEARFLSRVAREAECTEETAFTALSKTDADDSLPKLPDIKMRLVTTLTSTWTRSAECAYTRVEQAAGRLIEECSQASSLAHQDVLPAYLSATPNPIEAELAARLEGKRMDKSRVLESLETGLNETATLAGAQEMCAEPGVGATDLLLWKLDVGGFSAVSRNSAEDLRDKADYLGIVWTKKHGRTRGLQHYGHVRSLVLSDAGRAFESTKNEEHQFGLTMLSELRSRFKQRRTEACQLYDCSDEHLEGFAYSLTSECKVHWSLEQPWETK
jgi:Cap4, dsDNA endonuclease domain